MRLHVNGGLTEPNLFLSILLILIILILLFILFIRRPKRRLQITLFLKIENFSVLRNSAEILLAPPISPRSVLNAGRGVISFLDRNLEMKSPGAFSESTLFVLQ